MNKVNTIDREAVSWKFLFKIQKVNPVKQFGKHYLDRGSVHASEIGWAHGKIQLKAFRKNWDKGLRDLQERHKKEQEQLFQLDNFGYDM